MFGRCYFISSTARPLVKNSIICCDYLSPLNRPIRFISSYIRCASTILRPHLVARPFHAQSMLPRKERVTISVIYLAASRDRLRGSHVTCSIPFIQRRSPKIVMRISKTSAPVNVAATDHGDSSDIIAIKSRPGAPIYLYFALIMPTRFVRWRKYSRGTFNISAPTLQTPMFARHVGTSQIGNVR